MISAARVRIFDNSPRSLARLFQIRLIARKPSQAGIGVCHCRGNRLIHFVRQGGSQLSHGGHSADVREIRLRLTQRFSRHAFVRLCPAHF